MKKKLLAAALSAAGIGAAIFGILYLKQVSDYQDNIASLTFAGIDLTAVSDGTYIGEYDAGMVSAKVQVTVENHAIQEIKLLEHNHDRGASAESILVHMVEKQKTDVDAVTGATNSSKVIRKADKHIIEVGENIKMVCKRFLDSGMTPAQVAKRMDVPMKFVNTCMR